MIIIFSVLGLLYILEFSTSIIRRAAYNIDHPEAGLQLQTSLGVLSRFLMLIMMPVLGYMADNDILSFSENQYYLVITILMYSLAFKIRTSIRKITEAQVRSVLLYGSLFKLTFEKVSYIKYITKKNKIFNKLFITYFLIYIPYYISWPICFYLLEIFNENRAMIISSAGLISGVNTMILNVFIDPLLIKLGRKKKLIDYIYHNLIRMKFYSFLVSNTILLLILWFI